MKKTVKEKQVKEKQVKKPIKNITYSDMYGFVRADMYCGAAQDEYISDEQIHMRTKSYYNEYLNGVSLDELFMY